MHIIIRLSHVTIFDDDFEDEINISIIVKFKTSCFL